MFFSDGGKRSAEAAAEKIPCPQAGGRTKRQIRFYIFDLFSANLGYIKNLAGSSSLSAETVKINSTSEMAENSFEEGCQFIKIALADSEGCVTENG